jgi:hypothetical protein
MDVAGLLAIVFAVVQYVFFHVPVQPGIDGSLGAYLQDLALELIGSFGMLLLLGRPLLWLRWWRDWIVFLWAGILLVIPSLVGFPTLLCAVPCLLMALIFSIAQWLVRRGEPTAADAPSEKPFLWKGLKL